MATFPYYIIDVPALNYNSSTSAKRAQLVNQTHKCSTSQHNGRKRKIEKERGRASG